MRRRGRARLGLQLTLLVAAGGVFGGGFAAALGVGGGATAPAALSPVEAEPLAPAAPRNEGALTRRSAALVLAAAKPFQDALAIARQRREEVRASRRVLLASAPATPLGCLTEAIYYEARGESAEGQRAVADVVLTRARTPGFPQDACGVVRQRSSRGCQFSYNCDGSTARPVDQAAWRRAEAVAQDALEADSVTVASGATHYHASSVQPKWADSFAFLGRIGDHLFYADRGRAGVAS